jgi:HAD superfamily hydrolase (TIGR01509 family)
MARAILFDLNGVIEDVNPFLEQRDDLIVSTVKEIASEAAIRSAAIKIRSDYDSIMSSSLSEFHLMFWDDLLRRLGAQADNGCLFSTYQTFIENYLPISRVFPDTYNLLRSIQNEFDFGVLSNANSFRARSFLQYHSLHKLFKTIVISHDTPYAKPNKEIFQLAAYRLGKHPSEVIMIGDRLDNDIEGAKQAGMIPILLDRASEGKISGPSYTVLTKLDGLSETLKATANQTLLIGNDQSFRPKPKVVIVCGGEGSRLRPKLGNRQKCLAVVNGKPILFHTIDALLSAGLSEIDLVAGASTADVEEAILHCDRYSDCQIRVLPISAPGTGRAVQDYWRNAKEDGRDIIYSHGNIIVDPVLMKRFIERAQSDIKIDISLLGSPAWVAETHAALLPQNGIIEKIITDASEHKKGNLCSVGLAFVRGHIPLDRADISERGMFEDIVEFFRENNNLRIGYYFSDQSWEHLGVPKDWDRLNVEV